MKWPWLRLDKRMPVKQKTKEVFESEIKAIKHIIEMYDAKAASFEDEDQPPEEDVTNARP